MVITASLDITISDLVARFWHEWLRLASLTLKNKSDMTLSDFYAKIHSEVRGLISRVVNQLTRSPGPSQRL